MSPPIFYFINHTTKQFCIFDNTISIMRSIEIAIQKNLNWSFTDEIQINSQLSNYTHLIEYLINDLEYRDLND
jgi:hypothetical protein